MTDVIQIDKLTQFRIINALKKFPDSQIYKDLNKQIQQKQPPQVVLLSTSQNDFVIGIHKKQQITTKSINTLKDALLTLDKTAINIKKDINNQYTSLIQILQNRKNALNNDVDNIINNKKKKIYQRLTSTIKTQNALKSANDKIEQCLASKTIQYAKKQSKLEEIINNSSVCLCARIIS